MPFVSSPLQNLSLLNSYSIGSFPFKSKVWLQAVSRWLVACCLWTITGLQESCPRAISSAPVSQSLLCLSCLLASSPAPPSPINSKPHFNNFRGASSSCPSSRWSCVQSLPYRCLLRESTVLYVVISYEGPLLFSFSSSPDLIKLITSHLSLPWTNFLNHSL